MLIKNTLIKRVLPGVALVLARLRALHRLLIRLLLPTLLRPATAICGRPMPGKLV